MGWRGRVAALLATATLASACTGGAPAAVSPSTDGPPATAAAVPSTSHPAVTTAPTTTTQPAEPAAFPYRHLTRDELLAIWAEDRVAAVERITSAGWGVGDDGVLRGPGGLEVDLERCPDGWSNDGPRGDDITLLWWSNQHWARGPESARAYLEWLGDDASAGGRPIVIDHYHYEFYDPDAFPRTAEQEAEQERQNRTAVGGLSTDALAVTGARIWNQTRTIPTLIDEHCIPALGVHDNTEREPETNPWSAPSPGLLRSAEVAGWFELAADLPAGDRVVLVMDNEWGHVYEDELRALGASEETGWRFVHHDPDLREVDYGRLAGLLVDDAVAVFMATAGNPCLVVVQSIRALRQELPVVLPTVCTQRSAYIDPMAENAVGIGTMFGHIASHAGPHEGTTLAVAAEEATEAESLPWLRADEDWFAAWYLVEVVKIAAELPAGVTRTNLLLAMWSFEGRHPYAASHVDVHWPDDMRMHDEAAFLRYDFGARRWLPASGIADLDRPLIRTLGRADLLARWAEERAAARSAIETARWGVVDGVLTGPGGLTFDLTQCQGGLAEATTPRDPTLLWWQATHHDPSGESAARFFDWLGAEGELAGTAVRVDSQPNAVSDPGSYAHLDEEATRAENLAYVAEAREQVIAVLGFGENANNLSFRQLFDEACLPSIAPRSGEPTVPTTHAWSLPPASMPLETEADLWWQWAWERGWSVPGDTAMLVMDNDIGHRIADAVERRWIDSEQTLHVRLHDPADPDLTDDARWMVETGATTHLVASVGYPCAAIARAVGELDPRTPIVIPDRGCASLQLPDDLQLGDGNLVTFRARYAPDDQVAIGGTLSTAVEASEQQSQLSQCCIYGAGDQWVEAWIAWQTLRLASELPGGLHRANVLLAGWVLAGSHPFLEGHYAIDFGHDRRGLESARRHQWNPDTGTWDPTDEVLHRLP